MWYFFRVQSVLYTRKSPSGSARISIMEMLYKGWYAVRNTCRRVSYTIKANNWQYPQVYGPCRKQTLSWISNWIVKKNGLTDIVLCIGHKGDIIQNHFGDGSNINITISYSLEDTLLGTGGALRKATNILKDSFLVLYGDSYLDIDYRKIINYLKQIDCPALLAVYKNEGKFDTSNVIFIDGELVLYDKQNVTKEMQYIDSGL